MPRLASAETKLNPSCGGPVSLSHRTALISTSTAIFSSLNTAFLDASIGMTSNSAFNAAHLYFARMRPQFTSERISVSKTPVSTSPWILVWTQRR